MEVDLSGWGDCSPINNEYDPFNPFGSPSPEDTGGWGPPEPLLPEAGEGPPIDVGARDDDDSGFRSLPTTAPTMYTQALTTPDPPSPPLAADPPPVKRRRGRGRAIPPPPPPPAPVAPPAVGEGGVTFVGHPLFRLDMSAAGLYGSVGYTDFVTDVVKMVLFPLIVAFRGPFPSPADGSNVEADRMVGYALVYFRINAPVMPEGVTPGSTRDPQFAIVQPQCTMYGMIATLALQIARYSYGASTTDKVLEFDAYTLANAVAPALLNNKPVYDIVAAWMDGLKALFSEQIYGIAPKKSSHPAMQYRRELVDGLAAALGIPFAYDPLRNRFWCACTKIVVVALGLDVDDGVLDNSQTGMVVFGYVNPYLMTFFATYNKSNCVFCAPDAMHIETDTLRTVHMTLNAFTGGALPAFVPFTGARPSDGSRIPSSTRELAVATVASFGKLGKCTNSQARNRGKDSTRGGSRGGKGAAGGLP